MDNRTLLMLDRWYSRCDRDDAHAPGVRVDWLYGNLFYGTSVEPPGPPSAWPRHAYGHCEGMNYRCTSVYTHGRLVCLETVG